MLNLIALVVPLLFGPLGPVANPAVQPPPQVVVRAPMAAPVNALAAAEGDSTCLGKDDNLLNGQNMSFVSQAFQQYTAWSGHKYNFTFYNKCANGGSSKNMLLGYTGSQTQALIDWQNKMGQPIKLIIIVDAINEMTEPWKYGQTSSWPNQYTQRMTTAFNQIRLAFPNATIVFVGMRDVQNGCYKNANPWQHYVEPYYEFGPVAQPNTYVKTANGILPYVNSVNSFINYYQATDVSLYHHTSFFFDLSQSNTVSGWRPDNVATDYGQPSDFGTSCLHPNYFWLNGKLYNGAGVQATGLAYYLKLVP